MANADMTRHVPARVDRGPSPGKGLLRVGHGRPHLVVDADGLDRPTSRFGMVGGHDRHRLPNVPDFVGGQDGLVRHLDAVETVSGYVLGGQHGGNPPDRQGMRDVNTQHAGPRVRTPHRGAPQHAVDFEVRGVGESAQHLERRVGTRG